MSRLSAASLAQRHAGATLRALVMVMVMLMLVGCGKKGAPQPPPDEPSTYPRAYPHE
jgi:predicted small lipoprotein YifL